MQHDIAGAGRRRGSGARVALGAILLGVVVAGAIVWGVVSREPSGEAATSPSTSLSPPPTPPSTSAASPKASEAPAPLTTPVTAPVTSPPSDAEVPFDEPAPPQGGAIVQIVGTTAGTFSGQVPGEPSGDTITVAVRVVNDGSTPVDTGSVGVNLSYGGDDRTPGIAVADKSARVFPASVAPGAEATADFTFVAPLAAGGDVRVSVDLLASEPEIVFVGPRP